MSNDQPSQSQELFVRSTNCPFAYEVYRLITGELPPQEKGQVLDHVKGCETCRNLVQKVEGAKLQWVEKLDQDLCWEACQSKMAIKPEPDPRAWISSPKTKIAFATIGLIVLFAVAMLLWHGPQEIRIKGGIDAELWIERSGKIIPSIDNNYVPGDRLQIQFRSSRGGFAFLFLVSLRREVTLLYPPEGKFFKVESLVQTRFPNSLVLDDSMQEERILLVVSPSSNREEILSQLNHQIRNSTQWGQLKLQNAEVVVWQVQKGAGNP